MAMADLGSHGLRRVVSNDDGDIMERDVDEEDLEVFCIIALLWTGFENALDGCQVCDVREEEEEEEDVENIIGMEGKVLVVGEGNAKEDTVERSIGIIMRSTEIRSSFRFVSFLRFLEE